MTATTTRTVTVLRSDGDVRERYLTAVLSRVLTLQWDAAYDIATTGCGLTDAGQLATVIAALRNIRAR